MQVQGQHRTTINPCICGVLYRFTLFLYYILAFLLQVINIVLSHCFVLHKLSVGLKIFRNPIHPPSWVAQLGNKLYSNHIHVGSECCDCNYSTYPDIGYHCQMVTSISTGIGSCATGLGSNLWNHTHQRFLSDLMADVES